VLASVLNGLFLVLRGQLDSGSITLGGQGSGLPTFSGLLLAGGLAIVVTAVVTWLINRDINRSLSGKQPQATLDPTVGDRQANAATIGTFAILLLIGAFVWNSAVNRATSFDVGGFQGSYPSTFGRATGDEDVLRVADLLGTGAEFAIQTPAIQATWDTSHVAAQLAAERANRYVLYKVLSSGLTTVNGKPALTQHFAYVDPGGLTGAAPAVLEGIDYIFVDNGTAVVVTLLTNPDDLPEVEPMFARFLNSLQF